MNHNFLNVSRWLISPIYSLWRWLNAMKIRLKAPLLWFCRPWIVHVQVNNCENCSLDIVAYISSLIDTLQCSCCSFYEELIWENNDQIIGMWSLNHIFSERSPIEGFVWFFFFLPLSLSSFFVLNSNIWFNLKKTHNKNVNCYVYVHRVNFWINRSSFQSPLITFSLKKGNKLFGLKWKNWMLFKRCVLRSDIWFVFHVINENNIHCCQHISLNFLCVDVVAFSIFKHIYQEKHNNIDTKCYGDFPTH